MKPFVGRAGRGQPAAREQTLEFLLDKLERDDLTNRLSSLFLRSSNSNNNNNNNNLHVPTLRLSASFDEKSRAQPLPRSADDPRSPHHCLYNLSMPLFDALPDSPGLSRLSPDAKSRRASMPVFETLPDSLGFLGSPETTMGSSPTSPEEISRSLEHPLVPPPHQQVVGVEPAERRRRDLPRVSRVSPVDVFNLPICSSFFIVDARPYPMYIQGHVSSALNIPPPEKGVSEHHFQSSVLKVIEKHIDDMGEPENLGKIVVYGPESHVNWLVRSLSQLVMEGENLQTAYPSDNKMRQQPGDPRSAAPCISQKGFVRFLRRLHNTCKDICVLEGGYQAFLLRFPCLTDRKCATTNHLRPTPIAVCPGVFLGSRHVDLCDNVLLDLGIRGAIVSQNYYKGLKQGMFSNQGGGHQATKNINDDLLYLPVTVADTQDFKAWSEVWTASVHFIAQAQKNRTSVIIQVLNRSRSASVAAAWLMVNQNLNAHQACRQICQLSRKVTPQLLMVDDLETWSRSLAKGGSTRRPSPLIRRFATIS